MDDMPIDLNTIVVRQFAAPQPPNHFEWMDDFAMPIKEASELSDREFIIDGFIVAGHPIVVAVKPNGEKTTILFSQCEHSEVRVSDDLHQRRPICSRCQGLHRNCTWEVHHLIPWE